MNKSVIWIILGILVLAGGLIFTFDHRGTFPENEEYQYKIKAKWELPPILDEVSGIEWLGNHRIACVQDEDGIIFIYNLETSEIERRIDFAGSGDYEGLTVNAETAYVVRSDGSIFEISDFHTERAKTRKFDTFLTEEQNVEGVCFDKPNNRLLLAIKDKESDQGHYKGVYAFDLRNNQLAKKAIFNLKMEDKLLRSSEKKLSKRFRPSEIEIHPNTGEIFLLDAKDPKVVIIDKQGGFKKVFRLDEDEFNQPEGLSFTPEDTLYISNEAGGDPANILQVELRNQ